MVSLQSLKLLADIILEPKNFKIMMKYIGVSPAAAAATTTATAAAAAVAFARWPP